jgi:hypothetical protein
MMRQATSFPPNGTITIPDGLDLLDYGTSSSQINNTQCNILGIVEQRKSPDNINATSY